MTKKKPPEGRRARRTLTERLQIWVGVDPTGEDLPSGDDLSFKPDPMAKKIAVRFDGDGRLVADLTVYLGALKGRFACSFAPESMDLYDLEPGFLWVDVDSFLAESGDQHGDFIHGKEDVDLKLHGTDLFLPWSDFRMECGEDGVISFVVTLVDRTEFTDDPSLAKSDDLKAAMIPASPSASPSASPPPPPPNVFKRLRDGKTVDR